MQIYRQLLALAKAKFADVVVDGAVMTLSTGDPQKLRLLIADGSLIDVYLSKSGRYSYHWERRMIGEGTIYRHDNAPHPRWQYVSTFPKHFHNGQEENVIESYLSSDPSEALSEVLRFARAKLTES